MSSQAKTMAAISNSNLANPHQEDTKMPPSFFSLPAEIRLMIYRHLFANYKVYLHRRRNCANKGTVNSRTRGLSALNVLLVNHRMHGEVMPVYLSDTLFSVERYVCGEYACNADKSSNRARHQSPHFGLIQRVECTDLDAHRLMRAKGSIKELVLLVEYHRWIYLLGAPWLPLSVWRFMIINSNYMDELLHWLEGTSKKVILHKDCSSQPWYSKFKIWPSDSPAAQRRIEIIFEGDKDVVAKGISQARQQKSEALIRDVFLLPSDKAVRFELVNAG